MTTELISAYLDANVVSTLAKDDIKTEANAVDRLLRAYDDGKVRLVTSHTTC